jgi:hypothetical protein
MTQEYIGTKQITGWPADKDGIEGFAVKYADGYTSWSPKDVFEAAYLPIGHVTHLPPFHQRLIGEKAQLDERRTKLHAFVESAAFAEQSSTSQRLLTSQVAAMDEYSELLAQRLAAL